jgi:hypothetical protein
MCWADDDSDLRLATPPGTDNTDHPKVDRDARKMGP